MKTIKEQFTRYDAEELHPECNNSEYLEYKEVISGLGSAICSYGFKVIDEKEGQKEYKYFWAKKTDICAYCGEYKWENKEKHIAEIATFLQQKIRELQEILLGKELIQ